MMTRRRLANAGAQVFSVAVKGIGWACFIAILPVFVTVIAGAHCYEKIHAYGKHDRRVYLATESDHPLPLPYQRRFNLSDPDLLLDNKEEESAAPRDEKGKGKAKASDGVERDAAVQVTQDNKLRSRLLSLPFSVRQKILEELVLGDLSIVSVYRHPKSRRLDAMSLPWYFTPLLKYKSEEAYNNGLDLFLHPYGASPDGYQQVYARVKGHSSNQPYPKAIKVKEGYIGVGPFSGRKGKYRRGPKTLLTGQPKSAPTTITPIKTMQLLTSHSRYAEARVADVPTEVRDIEHGMESLSAEIDNANLIQSLPENPDPSTIPLPPSKSSTSTTIEPNPTSSSSSSSSSSQPDYSKDTRTHISSEDPIPHSPTYPDAETEAAALLTQHHTLSSLPSPILHTCRQLYQETIPLLYSLNTFHFTSTADLSFFIQSVRPQHISRIKSLSLTLRAHFRSDWEDWKCIWPLIASKLTSLEELKLELGVYRRTGSLVGDGPSEKGFLRDVCLISGVKEFEMKVWYPNSLSFQGFDEAGLEEFRDIVRRVVKRSRGKGIRKVMGVSGTEEEREKEGKKQEEEGEVWVDGWVWRKSSGWKFEGPGVPEEEERVNQQILEAFEQWEDL